MKSKFLLAFLAPALLMPISGCTKQLSGMKLTYGTYITTEQNDKTDAKEIEYSDLYEKMDAENGYGYNTENFIVVIYPTNGCLCWNLFQPKLKAFIADTHYLVYQINMDQFNDQSNLGFIFKQGNVSLAIVKAGKIQKQYMASAIFDSVEALKAEINKFVRAPELYYIDEAFLREKRNATRESFLVSYVRCNCSDCNYATPRALWQYAYKNTFKTKMYVIDIQSIRDAGADEYQEFKDYYYLSEKLNPDYGYGTGVVPTIHYYKNGEVNDATVFFNDTVELIDGEYKITNTFYSRARASKLHYLDNVKTKILEGLTIPATEIEEYSSGYGWSKDKAFKYHQPLFEAFMDTYTK